MPPPRPPGSKRPRNKYSRVICLGCRERRIRCELPSDTEIPNPGELRTVETPCYRCQRLGVPCVIRQTVLGRPGRDSRAATTAGSPNTWTSDVVSRIIIDLESPAVAQDESPDVENEIWPVNRHSAAWMGSDVETSRPPEIGCLAKWTSNTLLIHKPQSAETVLILRAADTLRRECVEDEWFRHLGAHIGHTQALDLSIKAMVAACAYSRGVPKLTSADCYQALSRALKAVQANLQLPDGDSSDDILASTALLAPFEGVIKKNGIPTRVHVDGLAAILAARPASSRITQLARDIVDFYACETAVVACIQDTISPFECIPPAYFANDRAGCTGSDQAQLKALGKEIFIRMPRLVKLARLLRRSTLSQQELLANTLRLLEVLLGLQDPQAEGRLLRNVGIKHENKDASSPFTQSLQFASVQDYEALAYYWQGRLSLLRLKLRLHSLAMSNPAGTASTDDRKVYAHPYFGLNTAEMLRLAKMILMCSEYASALRLRKQNRLSAHAAVVVWGVKKDLPAAVDSLSEHQGNDPTCDLLLRRANRGLGAGPGLTSEDLDTAAEIFVGGPRKGRFAELFGL